MIRGEDEMAAEMEIHNRFLTYVYNEQRNAGLAGGDLSSCWEEGPHKHD